MSAGLAASTVTPGSTAPVASFTTPANALWARAMLGNRSTAATTSTELKIRLFIMPVPPRTLKSLSVPVAAGLAVRNVESITNYGNRTKSVLILQKVGLSVGLTALIEDQALPECGGARVEAAGGCQIDTALDDRDSVVKETC